MEQHVDLNTLATVPTNSINALNKFILENEYIVYKYMFNMMIPAIKHNWKSIILFKIGTTDILFKLINSNYEILIRKMQAVFVKHEDYEKAEICNKMLIKHKVNMLLNS